MSKFKRYELSSFILQNMYINTYEQHDPEACARPPDEKDTFLNEKRLTLHSHLKFQK